MSTTTPQLEQVDVRGPRFAAWVTTGVLVLTLILSTFSLPAATVVLALQAIVFAVGAVLGPKRSPYGQIFGKLVAPRLSPVSEREPVAPLRFAQFVAAYRLLGVVLVKAVRCWAGRIGSLGSPVVGRVAGMQLRFGVVLVVFMHALCNPDYGSDKSRSWYQIEVRCQKTACSSISACLFHVCQMADRARSPV